MKPTEVLNTLEPAAIRAAIKRNGYDVTETGCHIFRGPKTTQGYGRLNIGRLRIQAHRAAWVAENGPMDPSKDACHQCDTRDCINADHIFPGSRRENMLDASEKSRLHAHVSPETMPRGERHGMAKLSLEIAYHIKTSDEPSAILRERYGVNRSTINKIRSGAQWAGPLRELVALKDKEVADG